MFSISYKPLWETLQSRGMKQIDLVKNGVISPSALKRLQKEEPVSLNVIGSICVSLDAEPGNIVAFKKLEGTV